MLASASGNRRAWLVVVVACLVLLLMALSARAETLVYDGGVSAATAAVTSDRDPVNAAGIAQKVCDDFTAGAGAHTVTDVEWKGLYGALGQTAASETFSPADEFSIVFYDDDAGMPGNVISQYHPRQVTRTLLDNGAWSYRYSLPNPLELKPGRRYHVAIANNLPGSAYWCWSQDDSFGANHSAPTGSSDWIRWPGNCALRLSYTERAVEASAKLPMLLIGLIASCAFGLHRYVL
ncbi:MAG: hypothetical protein RBU21_03540 [FCB group bacterium]|jgi:hypothetical protein|nr:hypothetical protein [FCB group bacterium]